MALAYLFAAIAGVILLAVALFGGGEHGAAGGVDTDGDGIADAPAADIPAEHGAGEAHGGGALGALGVLLSLRFWTYTLAFGGLTGLALRYLARVHEPWAALVALACGAASGLIARAIVHRAAVRTGTPPLKTRALVGRSAAVIVPFEPGTTGKIRVQVDDRTLDLLATTDDPALGSQDEVLIVEVRDDATAHVTRNPVRGPR